MVAGEKTSKQGAPKRHGGPPPMGKKLARGNLPPSFARLFWDCDFKSLRVPRDLGFVASRLLTSGGLKEALWLRQRIGDDGLREWLVSHKGGSLDTRRVRFWSLVLGIPKRRADGWLKQPRRTVWESKAKR